MVSDDFIIGRITDTARICGFGDEAINEMVLRAKDDYNKQKGNIERIDDRLGFNMDNRPREIYGRDLSLKGWLSEAFSAMLIQREVRKYDSGARVGYVGKDKDRVIRTNPKNIDGSPDLAVFWSDGTIVRIETLMSLFPRNVYDTKENKVNYGAKNNVIHFWIDYGKQEGFIVLPDELQYLIDNTTPEYNNVYKQYTYKFRPTENHYFDLSKPFLKRCIRFFGYKG